MFTIMIVNIPRGEEPAYIRQAWLGIILPCSGKFSINGSIGVLSGKPMEDLGLDVFEVCENDALKILQRSQPTAADWWYTNDFPKDGCFFTFYEDEVEVLPGDQGRDAWG